MQMSFNRRVTIAFRCSLIASSIHVGIMFLAGSFFDPGTLQKVVLFTPPKWSELSITVAMIIFSTMLIYRGEGENSGNDDTVMYVPLIGTPIAALLAIAYPNFVIWTAVILCFLLISVFKALQVANLFLCSLMAIFFGYQYRQPDLLWVCWAYIALMLIIVLFHPSSGLKVSKFITAADTQ